MKLYQYIQKFYENISSKYPESDITTSFHEISPFKSINKRNRILSLPSHLCIAKNELKQDPLEIPKLIISNNSNKCRLPTIKFY